jgi:hypothetical protein
MSSILLGLAILGVLVNAYEESKKSRPVSDWSASEVATWITKLEPSFGSYAEAFQKGAINGRALIAMDNQYALGVSMVFVRSL